MTANDASTDAELVRLRYTPPTDRVEEKLSDSSYVAYLRTAESGPVTAGDQWDHFVTRGCGTTQDVRLAVESVDGGGRIGESTQFVYLPAETDEPDETGTDSDPAATARER